jgi:hypothetical protein
MPWLRPIMLLSVWSKMNPVAGSVRQIYVVERVVMKLKAAIGLFLALSPVIASARPRPATPRVRTQVVRDRVPKAHVHTVQTRQR